MCHRSYHGRRNHPSTVSAVLAVHVVGAVCHRLTITFTAAIAVATAATGCWAARCSGRVHGHGGTLPQDRAHAHTAASAPKGCLGGGGTWEGKAQVSYIRLASITSVLVKKGMEGGQASVGAAIQIIHTEKSYDWDRHKYTTRTCRTAPLHAAAAINRRGRPCSALPLPRHVGSHLAVSRSSRACSVSL